MAQGITYQNRLKKSGIPEQNSGAEVSSFDFDVKRFVAQSVFAGGYTGTHGYRGS